MRKLRVFLLVGLMLLCFSSVVYAEWQIDISQWQNWLHSTQGAWTPDLGPSLRGHFATKPECDDARSRMDRAISARSSCVGYDSSKQGSGGGSAFGWGGGNINTEAGAKQFLLGGILNAILQGALNPPSAQVDTQAQQKLLWQKKQMAIKEEKARKAGFAKWQKLQDESALQRAAKQRQKKEQGAKLLTRLDKVGSQNSLGMEPVSGGSLGAFSRGNLDLSTDELQSIGSGRYDTSSLSPLKRLECAKYFSQAAADAADNGDAEKAEYLNQQAQKIMSGQMIGLECRFQGLPKVPEVPKPVKVLPVPDQKEAAYYDGLIKTVQQDAGRLRDIEAKLKETDRKIKQAKEKKQKAEQKVAEVGKSAAMAKKPQEKQEADDLLASAQALLQESQNEIKTAIIAKQALSKQKEQIMTQLKEIQKKIQPKTGTN